MKSDGWFRGAPILAGKPMKPNTVLSAQVNHRGRVNKKVYVIDEIGKMELFSRSFIQAVRDTLDSEVTAVLGTIPVPKGKPLELVEEIRDRSDIMIFTVTRENRDSILPDIVAALQDCLK
ncbi:NTPCR triphosphatase, partial [Polypterus senegalus]